MEVSTLPCQPVVSLSGILPDVGRLIQILLCEGAKDSCPQEDS